MKICHVASAGVCLASSALAAPTPGEIPMYGPPEGGWESVSYPEGTGANLAYYPPPPGGWESVDYPDGTGALPGCQSGSSSCNTGPYQFSSMYHVLATPDEVVNASNAYTGGLPGAVGYYAFGINAEQDLICWNIKLCGFRGEYSSPARTATHVHESGVGLSGPPRLAFPNPVGNEDEAISKGCMVGPFTTGLKDANTGIDTGVGFMVKEIEANPSAFNADVHSSLAVPGAVRGQFPGEKM